MAIHKMSTNEYEIELRKTSTSDIDVFMELFRDDPISRATVPKEIKARAANKFLPVDKWCYEILHKIHGNVVPMTTRFDNQTLNYAINKEKVK
jgi:hypothetical protein